MTTRYRHRGTARTAHTIGEILPAVLEGIGRVYQERPDLVMKAWPEVIGEKIAVMTQVVSFIDGVLVVKVRNSTLHSLLSQNDKPRVLKSLRQKFPHIQIKNIVFCLG